MEGRRGQAASATAYIFFDLCFLHLPFSLPNIISPSPSLISSSPPSHRRINSQSQTSLLVFCISFLSKPSQGTLLRCAALPPSHLEPHGCELPALDSPSFAAHLSTNRLVHRDSKAVSLTTEPSSVAFITFSFVIESYVRSLGARIPEPSIPLHPLAQPLWPTTHHNLHSFNPTSIANSLPRSHDFL